MHKLISRRVRHAKVLLAFFVAFANAHCQGQDSTGTFSIDSFMMLVRKGHPVARQSELVRQNAEAEILKAKGSFDPTIYSDFDSKKFDEKDYYDLLNTHIKFPTRIAASFKVGYEQTSGQFLNPENSTPGDGLLYAGIELPLLQGLIIDEQRTAIRSADVGLSIAEANADLLINNLMLNSLLSYYDWYWQTRRIGIYEEAVQLTSDRFDAVVIHIENGDEAPIDSVESLINLQNRLIILRKTQIEQINALRTLETFLWDSAGYQLTLSNTVSPSIPERFMYNEDSLVNHLSYMGLYQPELLAISQKNRQLEIERRWAKEQLKPQANLKYNFLNEGFNPSNSLDQPIITNNYKLGFGVYWPLPMRKARGELQKVKVKQLDNELKLDQKRASLEAKIRAIYNEINTLDGLFITLTENVSLYERLLEAEYEKFDTGESSIFLLNSREIKLIDAKEKLIKVEVELLKARAYLYWLTARLLEEIAD